MGNQWIKNYVIDKKPYLTGGQNSLWQIHNAKKHKEEFSVFIYDKRNVHKLVKNEKEREMIYTTLRKEAEKLSQIRHPQVLSVIEQPAEDHKRLVCVTEKVIGTLNSIVQNDKLNSCSLMDVKLIMLQIVEGLSFLHNDAKINHLNISPDNIYITSDGKVKIGGFIFSQPNPMRNAINTDIDLVPKSYDKQLQFYPDLAYMAPELTLNPSLGSPQSDIFSLGLILAGLLRLQLTGMKDLTLFQIQHITQYQQSFDCLLPFILKSPFFNQIQDQSLKELIVKMINKEMSQRPAIIDIYHHEFFLDPLIRLMHSLKQFQQFESEQQAALLKQISKSIFKFERQVIIKNILPNIMPLITNEKLMQQVIFIAIDVSKIQDPLIQEKYYQNCWTHIKKISGFPSIPAQALYNLVQNINKFYEIKIPDAEIQTHLIPLYVKCFESDVAKLQEVALNQTQMIMEKIEYQYTKNKILPRLLQLCLDSSNKEVNLSALQVLSKTQHIFDKVSISDNILPTLERFRKVTAPTKIQAQLLLEIYKSFLQHLNYEQIVNRLLPQLLPYIIELNIGKSLIQKYSELLQSLIQKIAIERMACLPDDTEENQQVNKEQSHSQITNQDQNNSSISEKKLDQNANQNANQNTNQNMDMNNYNWDSLQPVSNKNQSNSNLSSPSIGIPQNDIYQSQSQQKITVNQIPFLEPVQVIPQQNFTNVQQNNLFQQTQSITFDVGLPVINTTDLFNQPFINSQQFSKDLTQNTIQVQQVYQQQTTQPIDFSNPFQQIQPIPQIQISQISQIPQIPIQNQINMSKYKEFDNLNLLDEPQDTQLVKNQSSDLQIQQQQQSQQKVQEQQTSTQDKQVNINVNYDPFSKWGEF